jgi:hypothetical protein
VADVEAGGAGEDEDGDVAVAVHDVVGEGEVAGLDLEGGVAEAAELVADQLEAVNRRSGGGDDDLAVDDRFRPARAIGVDAVIDGGEDGDVLVDGEILGPGPRGDDDDVAIGRGVDRRLDAGIAAIADEQEVVSAASADLLDPVEEIWPAPGFEDTELGVILEPEVVYGTQTLCTRVQA